jgi:hypothetical protein
VPAIWSKAGSKWSVLSPAGFPDEAALHGLVEETPELLPLAGSPRLAIVGREVHLGPGYADLLAVESSGRLVVIEVKLAKNAEARRVVVAQVLTYASYLRGMDRSTLEKDLLGPYLASHGFTSLADAVKAKDQEGSFDAVAFDSGVASCLGDGRFRLVLVLDSAPAELTQLVGYLESVGDLVIDLVTVAAYQVGDERLLVPQRVEPERIEAQSASVSKPAPKGTVSEGTKVFADFVETLSGPSRAEDERLLAWAKGLENEGLARLASYHGTGGFATLLPYLLNEQVGLVSIDSYGNLMPWRTVFDRRAPKAIDAVAKAMAPVELGAGRAVKKPSDELLDAVRAAYREAANKPHAT